MDELISRQQAIYALRAMQTYKLFAGDDMLLIDKAGAQTELMLLPSAHPKKGRWIEGHRMKFDGTFYWSRECDQCGYERNDDDTEKDSNFCPNCGADMRGEKDEVD